jgi:hypothetical protein
MYSTHILPKLKNNLSKLIGLLTLLMTSTTVWGGAATLSPELQSLKPGQDVDVIVQYR